MDIAIIGGGMAGLTAGLYAARGGMEACVFEQFLPGGQTVNIKRLENFPGYIDGVDGATLCAETQQQAEAVGCTFCYENVVNLIPGKLHRIKTEKKEYTAKAVVIATGAVPRKLGLPREAALTGKGVSYCATCDGAFFRGKPVAVVGGGNTALTEALVLSRYASSVLLIHRRDSFRGSEILQKRVQETKNIQLKMNREVRELLGDQKLSGLRLYDNRNSLEEEVALDGLFVAVGVSPFSEFLEEVLPLNSQGGIITDRRLATKVPGIFAAGDCRDTVLRQVVTAAADGAIAAVSAIEYINEQNS